MNMLIEGVGLAFVVAGAIVAIVETHTLTFYLIPLALAFLISGLMTLTGILPSATLAHVLSVDAIVTAVIMILGLPLAHWMRRRISIRASKDASNDNAGRAAEVVELSAATGAPMRIAYRGTTWDAYLRPDEPTPKAGDRVTIMSRDGNGFVVTTQH